MRADALFSALEEFQTKLIEHRNTWAPSLDSVVPSFPLNQVDLLREQSQRLCRTLGGLRSYIERFDQTWIMRHPATGVTWNALDEATGLGSVAQIKGPSMGAVIEKLDRILGQVQSLEPTEDIPADPSQPIKLGLSGDRIMMAYLDLLHPFVSKGCSALYRDGHYAQAVEEAAKAVFQYLRNQTGLSGDGSKLAQTAFSVRNPVLAFSDLSDETKQNEQVGFMEMLSAFAKGVRHPLAHTHGRSEEGHKAFEYLVMSSLFCRRIDDAKPKPPAV